MPNFFRVVECLPDEKSLQEVLDTIQQDEHLEFVTSRSENGTTARLFVIISKPILPVAFRRRPLRAVAG